ncbi:MAG: glycosyltransferase family 1 protein [Chloroflexi bacterium]|nr:glycosyltransferase family 1 protein [Chloroflexota bacterium]
MRPVATYTVVPHIPEALERLPELAYNIRWSWDHETIGLFQRMDPTLWDQTYHNPIKMLGQLSQENLNALAADDGFRAHYERVMENFDDYIKSAHKAWYPQQFGLETAPQVAYFSFEFGLTECIPNYSGGLGVLAGDHLKAASDLNVPLIGVGLLYQMGYFQQYLNVDGWQQESYPVNDFYTLPLTQVLNDDGKPILISVTLDDVDVHAQIWQVKVGRLTLYLLDTNIPENPGQEEQDLTDQLYGGDREMRVKQEILLGIGGLRALYAMGIEPAVCHMNEGHSAFLSLERARILMERYGMSFAEAAAITSSSNVFTTHTPVPAGNDFFHPDLIRQYFKDYWPQLGLSEKEFFALGRFDENNPEEYFCMTILALRMAAYNNGVSQLHGDVARLMWEDVYNQVPQHEVPIGAVTNGVHTFSWISSEMSILYDRYLGPRWREDPTDKTIWERAGNIPDEELWRTHERRRERLVAFARNRLVQQLERRGAPPMEIDGAHEALDPEVLTIGFARRFATYKRATLLLRDEERLLRLMHSDTPIQLIFAGKAHPHDTDGKEFIRRLIHFVQEHNLHDRIVFLENYDMVICRYMVQGVDVWLNTPRRPMEASGTSGMKAAMNGVLHMSIPDGWWAEAYDRRLGWAIGSGEIYEDEELQDTIEANAAYDLIENDLIPSFYERGGDNLPRTWIRRMKVCIQELSPVFNTARMVQDYTRKYYYPALSHQRLLAQEEYSRGREFAAWLNGLQESWGDLEVGSMDANFLDNVTTGDTLRVTVDVHLGTIDPDSVAVELYEGQLNIDGEIDHGHTHQMHRTNGSDRGEGWHSYAVEFKAETSGRYGYTVRVVPRNPDADHALRFGLITWA